MIKAQDIKYETENYWVAIVQSGFEVYKKGITHSTRCAQIGRLGERGKQRAITEANRRQALYV